MKNFIPVILIIFIFALFVPSATFAATTTNAPQTTNTASSTPNPFTTNGMTQAEMEEKYNIQPTQTLISMLVNFLFGLGCVLATLNVVWQGFRLIGGGSDGAEKSKTSIIQSIIGLTVIAFAWFIVNMIIVMLGGSGL